MTLLSGFSKLVRVQAPFIGISVMNLVSADPNDTDAKYVHFFHEKIPSRYVFSLLRGCPFSCVSRQLAESTTTKVLDELIASQPQRLEFYRTRGIVHCFRDEYPQATKDFTHALKEARVVRKAKVAHRANNSVQTESRPRSRNKKRKGCAAKQRQTPPDGSSSIENGDDTEADALKLHPSVLPNAPDPIETQLLFLRGAAYLQQAIFMIEAAILKLEGIKKVPSIDGAELRLCCIENGKYGGVEIGNPEGPLGNKNGDKLINYRKVIAEPNFREQITSLLKKSVRDHEKFLAHFDSVECPGAIPDGDIAQSVDFAFSLSESIKPGNQPNQSSSAVDAPAIFTTYHPLLVESHFSILICQLMLADFPAVLPTFVRTAALVDGLEGYPVFLPPRSMGQAEFVEILERLASGWKKGIMPHSLSSGRGKGRLALVPASAATEEDRALPIRIPGRDRDGSSSSSHMGSSSQAADNGDSKAQVDVPLKPDAADVLDCVRILLSPVARRQKERSEKVAAEKAAGSGGGAAGAGNGGKKKPIPINIPLHGPRVEIVLAWLGAVHFPELDGA